MVMRALRDWRWIGSALAVLGLVAFLARRYLPTGDGPAPGIEPILTPTEAASHVGETATVCGTVSGTRYLARLAGRPTFLNFDGRHPDQAFTAVIWGEHRGRFDAAPERAYRGSRICVAGEILRHEGTPRIEIRGPGQLRVEGRSASSLPTRATRDSGPRAPVSGPGPSA